MNIEESIITLQGLQKQSEAKTKSELRLENQARAMVRSQMGWRLDLEEKERAKIAKRAEKFVSAVKKGGEPEPEYMFLAGFVENQLLAIEPIAKFRRGVKKKMEDIVKSLPIADWIALPEHDGIGLFGIAQIFGEAGDLRRFGNPAKLWKYLGLAVIDGKAQCKRLGAEEAEKQGYCPRRRSIMWRIGDSALKKHGKYGDLYRSRKEYEAAQDGERSKMHNHRRAQRYMEKRVLADLWEAWGDCAPELEPQEEMVAV